MRYLLLILAALFVFSGYSQETGDRYASRMTQDGTIFFIMPQKLSKTEGIRRFEYDMTCLTWSDTVTINFTIKSKHIETPENITIGSGDNSYKPVKTKILFIDLKKNEYEIRTSCQFLWPDIEKIFTDEQKPTFCLSQNGLPESATYKEGKWNKERKTLSNILNLFKYSKK